MSSIEDSLTYPMESDDWHETVLIGGVLTFLGFLVVPLFLVSGYLVRAIRANLDGEPEPPAFGNWGELLADGVKGVIIGVVYMLVPLVVMSVTVGSAMMAMAGGGDAGAAAGIGGMMVGMLLTFVLSLLFGYLSVVGIVNFAREERFGAAFDTDVLRDVGFDTSFAVPYLVSVGVLLVAGMVASIPVIGFLVGAFVSFYALIVAARLWADGFDEALGTSGSKRRKDLEETVA